jgi:metal-responsive CopG/Arc/MetJ family transcriptional regulator
MELIRVNLSLEKEVWCAFDALAPKRSKSRIINQLLKQEIDKLNRQRETEALAPAFKQAGKDKKRIASLKEWEDIDKEGWD